MILTSMKIRFCAALFALTSITATAADFTVRTPNNQFAFAINGTNSATLTLVRGQTYTFDVSTTTDFHPFRINSAGATPNSITSGTITYTVPTAAANYTYNCGVHGTSMQGTILTVPPPTPPVPNIVSSSFGNQIILRTSPATNTFIVVPEYRTNLNHTNWVQLTVLSNRFVNGTNETFCGRPPATNLFIRVKVQ
jgi:hypothetical protein